jgi:hypothetical protein
MTDTAATEIRNLVARPDVPDDGGVRIASTDDGALTLALSGGPLDGDQVVDDNGARIFLEPEAGQLPADKQLDADVDQDGQVRFSLAEQG